jgi:drug/metabolite transporter (DMT)-like permease
VDANSLFAGMIAGAVGVGYLAYGKKQGRFVPAICGILLIVYPYFTDNIWILLGVGAALCIAPFVFRG